MYNTQMLAERIKEAAQKKGITVKKALSDCEIGPNTVTKLGHGTDILTSTLCKIADYFGCSADYLLGRTDGNAISTADETEFRILQLFKQLDRIQQENVITRAELLAEQNEAEYNDKENVS